MPKQGRSSRFQSRFRWHKISSETARLRRGYDTETITKTGTETARLRRPVRWLLGDNTQKSNKLVFVKDDLHFWRRRRGSQGVFFDVKKWGEEFFFRGKKGGETFFLRIKGGLRVFFWKKKGGLRLF